MKVMTWDEVHQYCKSNRESDGFCRCSCCCSGPTYSNLACDYEEELPEGVRVLRGGNYGSCWFYVKESAQE